MNWKTTAIIFMILFFLLLGYNIFGITLYYLDISNTNDCLYNYCGDYPDAYYEDGICYCYDYDLLGNLVVAKTRY